MLYSTNSQQLLTEFHREVNALRKIWTICSIWFKHNKVLVVHFIICHYFSRDTTVKLWDEETLEELKSLGGHTGSVTDVVLLGPKQYGNLGM